VHQNWFFLGLYLSFALTPTERMELTHIYTDKKKKEKVVRIGTLTIEQERRKTDNNNGEMFRFISFSLLLHLEVLTKNTVSTHSYLINATMSDRSIKQDKRKEKGQSNMVDFT